MTTKEIKVNNCGTCKHWGEPESRPLAERVTAAEKLKGKQLEKQNATQQSVQTINVLMERFADTWRCYPEPKK